MDIEEFAATSGIPQGCSSSGVLSRITMIPLLAKLNCLPTYKAIKPYQLKDEKFLTKKGTPVFINIALAYAKDILSIMSLDLQNNYPMLIINEILEI